MRNLRWIALMLTLVVFGCQPQSAQQPAETTPATDGASTVSRPLRLASAPKSPLHGSWTSLPEYQVNRWSVELRPDSTLRVVGPGVDAEGRFQSSGQAASIQYAEESRIGLVEPAELSGKLEMEKSGDTLLFHTGLPNDPPIRLIRAQ